MFVKTVVTPSLISVMIIIMIAVDNPDLKAGVASLSRMLNLPEHPDHFVLLEVRCKL